MWYRYILDSNDDMQNNFSIRMQRIISSLFVSDGSASGDRDDVDAMAIYNDYAVETAWLDLHWIERFIYRTLREDAEYLHHRLGD